MPYSILTSPDERPDADVVLFDGNCRFCSAQVERLSRWDRGGRLSFLSLHDDRAKQQYNLSHDELMEQMHIVDRFGKVYRGAGAFRYLTCRLPSLWILAPLLHIPLSLPAWQWCYRQFAKRRYRLGRTDQCNGNSCSMHFHK